MSTLHRGLADIPSSLAPDELIGTISRLLVSAGSSLGTDLFTAKCLIDQASALIDWRAEAKAELISINPRTPALAPWQIKRLADFVATNLESAIRNADLAAIVGLSPSHFLKAFKQSFDVTPHVYVARCRIQHAKHLMLSTDQPLVQIALACGFIDQAHFSTCFRRVTGVTPTQWRRSRGECSAGLRNGRVACIRPDVNKIEQQA